MPAQTKYAEGNLPGFLPVVLTMLAGAMLFGRVANAQINTNLLTDFTLTDGYGGDAYDASCPGGAGVVLPGWAIYGISWGNYDIWGSWIGLHTNTACEPAAVPRPPAGTNAFKVYGQFISNNVANFSGIYQDNISGPGASYTADGWYLANAADPDTGPAANSAWIEVTFRDASQNILALYRSAIVVLTNTPFNTWIDLPVTNQYNPVTYVVTNTTSTLTAPPGTSFVRYQIVFQQPSLDGGSLYFDDFTLAQVGGAAYGDWNIVWSDEFNGTTINTNIWTFDTGNNGGWGNNEREYYTTNSQNAYVSNGVLHIVARQQSTNGFSYTSARIKSQGLFSWTYGRFEFRAKLPQGVGFWPALWMLGTNIATPLGWPGCGEIDVMENMGGALTNVQGSLHSGSDETRVYTLPGGSVTNFHRYLLEWTPNAISWFVDGVRYETQTNWTDSAGSYPFPFNQPFFLIMNLAVGGNYVGKPDTNTINSGSTFPGDMQVDYVRIYGETAPLQISVTKTNAHVSLTWPSNIVCHLQTSTNLGSGTANWMNLSGSPGALMVTPVNRSSFYRLESP